MYSVFDGDEVLVAQSGHDDKGRPEGQIVEVLTRAHTHIVGRYMEEGGLVTSCRITGASVITY